MGYERRLRPGPKGRGVVDRSPKVGCSGIRAVLVGVRVRVGVGVGGEEEKKGVEVGGQKGQEWE